VLDHLPPDLSPALATERDYQIGMTKFNMRRDYPQAAELLLKVAPRLAGDKAASAWFHGTRALSRVDRDDEAIAGYKQVVARFPASRFAAEAQFLSGWLDYNRGRYRESLPGLRATLERFGHSAFADDAAFCLAFGSFLLGDMGAAAQALARYAAMPPTGMTSDEQAARVAYWRARLAARTADPTSAVAGYREVNRRWPFTFYGVAARARLAEAGTPAPIALPEPTPTPTPISNPTLRRGVGTPDGSSAGIAGLDHSLAARLDELASVGLDVEAGEELERNEKAELARATRGGGGARNGNGNGAAIPRLLESYAVLQSFHRAYELSESRNPGALAQAPVGAARVWWQAAYPLAYREMVDRYAGPAGNPELFLYAIMRKESGFSPSDVSYADARGLLQMIPPTSARVAREAGLDFLADDLFEPETNIRLGALYIGGLSRKFHAQIPLVAGAYNAGPKAMARWCDQHGTHPMDEFVELIAFTQTREYAKRVVGIYARYRHLYGASPYVLPLVVDPRYEAAGPDF
jgi:soluble lytic murein transglycosylase